MVRFWDGGAVDPDHAAAKIQKILNRGLNNSQKVRENEKEKCGTIG
jgi:hypothetical protein